MMQISAQALEHFAAQVLESCGVPSEDARSAAHLLVLSDLRGVDTHGVRLLPIYARRILAGGVAKAPSIRILRQSPSTALLDGGAGLGQVVGSRAMSLAIQMARSSGTGFVAVRNTTHCAAVGNYALLALEHDMIGLCISNTYASMAVHGAARKCIGNNPMAIAAPAGRHAPFVLDMATSITSWHKIYMAGERGELLPDGMVLDAEGNPTRDPHRARGGSILPFGGAKGSGLAIAIDILSGVLSGGAFGRSVGILVTDHHKAERVSASFAALDVKHFMPIDEFKARADALIDEIKSTPAATGLADVLIPGERAHREMLLRQKEGIPLPETTRKALEDLAASVGLHFPA